MLSDEMTVRYIGGPTVLIEVAGLRLLTDPTFDRRGTEYKTSVYTLRKLSDPMIPIDDLGTIDVVLLSHDHHFDNLDIAGRDLLSSVGQVLTTTAGAERLGSKATGLAHWQEIDIPTKDDHILRVMGTPARHGPADGDRGPVTGFVLSFKGDSNGGAYVSGDTVWYEGIKEIADRFSIRTAILFMGAAVVKEVGPHHLTMTAQEAVQFAQCFPEAKIIPVHYEGWGHFTESREIIERAFGEADLSDRLMWLLSTRP